MQGLAASPNADLDVENLDLNNIKDDIIMIQFKLVNKDTMKTFNTQTFVNVPASKLSDINLHTLVEIVSKQSSTKMRPRNKKEQFLPFNKSILTRILYPCLNKQNLIVISHYSKKTILKHLKIDIGTGYQPGAAKGLFNTLFRLGFDENRLSKKKLTQQ